MRKPNIQPYARGKMWIMARRACIIGFGALGIGFAASYGIQRGASEAAYAAYVKKDYDEALFLFRNAGDSSGEGMVLLARGEVGAALEAFKRGGDLRGQGLVHLRAREFDAALECFKQCEDASGQGLAYLSLRQLENAERAFVRANDWSGLGLTYLEMQRWDRAEECFAKVNDARGKGLLALKMGKNEEASRCFDACGDLEGKAMLAMVQNDHHSAAEIYRKLGDDSGLGACLREMGDFAGSERAFLRANDHNGLGDLLSKLGDHAGARAAFAKAGNPVKVLQSFRNDHTLADHLDQAVNFARGVLQTRTDHAAEMSLELAEIHYELGDTLAAMQCFALAAGKPGFSVKSQALKARMLFRLGRNEEARATLGQAKLTSAVLDWDVREILKGTASLDEMIRKKAVLKPGERF